MHCHEAKAVVDGLQVENGDTLSSVFVDLLSPLGQEVGAAYDVKVVPNVLLFDKNGAVVKRYSGPPNAKEVKRLMES